MKALDFLNVTKANEVRYSDYILFNEDEVVDIEMFGSDGSYARLISGTIPAGTAMVCVCDGELLGCLNDAGAKADAVVRV
jgi:hypothetical protein